ncbi:acid phosphatase [Aestuariibacter sp. GS-14]|uniref:metallophosphoesterase n=1 Tax=Aestuariibacter sp. GS-14 TaxID=2590670 RepID=UPI00112C5EA7|nr:metallophosphoesterase [Aestuariibacter sp. GS-14]TPV53895.1 acid phosphatase [Aestuariibacter sp. GS-14]
MKIQVLWGVACLAFSAASLATDVYNEAYYQQHTIATAHQQVADKSWNWLVVGDWGRNGHFAQRDVARWMDIAAYQFDADMIVSTGDNFYDNGIASIDDPFWQTSFEQIYHGPHLFKDWYVVLGNHDYRGNWQAQIEYSAKSRRWNMPAQYYSMMKTLEDGATVHLLFLDTSPLNPDYQHDTKYAETQEQDATAQLTWLHQQLEEHKDATWTFVIAHHPLYSSGKRYGKNDAIRSVLEPLLEQYKVDAYFAGHEHDLQHNQPMGKHMAHFVSGAGSEVRPTGQHEFTRFAASSAGFAAVSINARETLIQFIDDHGKVIYHYSLQPHKGVTQ